MSFAPIEVPLAVEGAESVSLGVDMKLAPAVNPTAPPKDVNFYDYDGTIRYSYTASEFAALTALPDNPVHEGLTAQGWNWTLADAQDYVAAYGWLDVGQMYVTDDGATRFTLSIVSLAQAAIALSFSQDVSGGVSIDWGDGAAAETISGTGTVSASHTYAAPGEYTLALLPAEGCTMTLVSAMFGADATSDGIYRGASAVTEVYLGENLTWGTYNYVFMQCNQIRSITIPKGPTVIPQSFAFRASALKHITIPSSVTTVRPNAFRGISNLRSVSLPKGMGNPSGHGFSENPGLRRIVLPPRPLSNVNTFAYNSSLLELRIPGETTSIAGAEFIGAYSLEVLRFYAAEPPAITNSNAFGNLYTGCVICVPYAGLAAYLSAANYPSPSTYTYIGYAAYADGAALPTQDSTEGYDVTWYGTKADALAGTDPITQGSGGEIYCVYTEVTA